MTIHEKLDYIMNQYNDIIYEVESYKLPLVNLNSNCELYIILYNNGLCKFHGTIRFSSFTSTRIIINENTIPERFCPKENKRFVFYQDDTPREIIFYTNGKMTIGSYNGSSLLEINKVIYLGIL